MKRAMGIVVCMAVLGTFGVPATTLAGAAESASVSKVADKKGSMSKEASKVADSSSSAKQYPEPIWSTDTVMPEPPKKAPAPKPAPYTGEIWSTDTVPAGK